MAMPDSSPQLYTLKLNHKCEYCCDYGNEELDLTRWGYSPASGIGNLWWGYKEVRPALGNMALRAGTPTMEPYDFTLETEYYATGSVWDLWVDYHETVLKALHQAQTGIYDDSTTRYPHHKYLEIGLWSGAAWKEFRLYVELVGFDMTPVKGTQMRAIPSKLYLRAIDPIWYNVYNNGYSWSPTNEGSGAVDTDNTQVVDLVTHANRRMERLIIKLTHGTGTIKNPTVTNDSGESFTITGELDAGYWLVDMVEGRLYEGGNYAAQTDVTGSKFSGDFLGLDAWSTDTLTVTAEDPSESCTFTARVETLRPEF